MNTLLKTVLLLLCCLSVSKTLHADITVTSCPSGFKPTMIAGVCVAQSLSTSVLQSVPATGQCNTGYAQVIGTRFCTKDYAVLNRVGNNYLISAVSSANCPANFSRAPGSSICTANHLALDSINNELKLIEPILACPSGTVQLPGAMLCSPVSSSGALPSNNPVGLECAPGFLKPYGSHFCIAVNIAVNTSDHQQFGLTPPTGQCPTYWRRIQNGGFCLPSTNIVACGTAEYPCRQEPNDTFFVIKDRFVCPVNGATRQGNTSPFTPNDPLGLTAIPHITCSPPGMGQHW